VGLFLACPKPCFFFSLDLISSDYKDVFSFSLHWSHSDYRPSAPSSAKPEVERDSIKLSKAVGINLRKS